MVLPDFDIYLKRKDKMARQFSMTTIIKSEYNFDLILPYGGSK
jgi:hypothetical protein